MKRIGICYASFRKREYVLFEAKKWAKVLEDLGFEIYHLDVKKVLPPLWGDILTHVFAEKRAEDTLFSSLQEVNTLSQKVCGEFVDQNLLDLLIVEDLFSSPYGIFFARGLSELIDEKKIKVIAHHHNFWWWDEIPRSKEMRRFLEMYLPPDLPHIRHVVLNSIDQAKIYRTKGIRAWIVPYMCNAEHISPVMGDTGEMVAFSPDIPGMIWDYIPKLKEYMGKGVKWVRSLALEDLYSASFLLYPATHQGWGPYILEAMCSKIPIIISQYKVYKRDISPFEFKVIPLGDVNDVERVGELLIDTLSNPHKKEEMVDHNLEIVKRCFSFSVLKEYITSLLEDISGE